MIEHLKSRWFDPGKYHCWISESLQVPLFGFNHSLQGVLTYTPSFPKKNKDPRLAKYFTRARGQPVWGLEVPVRGRLIFLTESIFKSASLHSLGLNSWSVLSSSISTLLYQQLILLPYQFVCLGDDDMAGEKFSRTFRYGKTSKDLDELSPGERIKVIDEFLFLESK